MSNDKKRRDSKGRVLRSGESQRSDGRYTFRYIDNLGKRQSVYGWKLVKTDRVKEGVKEDLSLREKEEQILKDLADNILINKNKISVNHLFDSYMGTKSKLSIATRNNYKNLWNNHIRNTGFGRMRVADVKKSDILKLYNTLATEHELGNGTIQLFQNILYPCFELAVDDDLIRKNPARNCMKDFSTSVKNGKKALSQSEQRILLEFVASSKIYNIYYPLLSFMISTACRCGETIGLTWNDIDMSRCSISINHQLIYKKVKDKIIFYIKEPKTLKGIRDIPFNRELLVHLKEQRKYQNLLGIDDSCEIDGYKGFVFTTKHGTPIKPNSLNCILKNIVNAYNREESLFAKEEKREALLLPHISAHTLRHTGCTRMAEKGMDVKVLQYIMGHSNISVTMEIYNHINEERVQGEMAKVGNIL